MPHSTTTRRRSPGEGSVYKVGERWRGAVTYTADGTQHRHVVSGRTAVEARTKVDSYAEADIVVELRNTGSSWVEILAGDSDFTIYNASGGVEHSGTFLYAYRGR